MSRKCTIDLSNYEHLEKSEKFHCADFAALIYKDYLGLSLPIGESTLANNETISQAIADNKPLFEKVEFSKRNDFDIIYMKEEGGRRHVGLYMKRGHIIHLTNNGVTFQKITAELSGRIIGYFRLKDMEIINNGS